MRVSAASNWKRIDAGHGMAADLSIRDIRQDFAAVALSE